MQDRQCRAISYMKTTMLANALRTAMLGAVVTGSSTFVLAEFASQAGITLPIEPGLVDGLRSSGLRGDVSVAEGLQQILNGSGLQAVEQGQGLYVLTPGARSGTGRYQHQQQWPGDDH